MKLRYSPTSPFVRKVVVTAIEAGISERIERIPTNTRDPANGLAVDNPLSKVPALVTDDGEALYDSPVICEYLDHMHAGAKLFPPPGAARWTALRRQALADGLIDAAILRMLENRRSEDLRSTEWMDKQKGKMEQALDALEADAASFGDGFDIGHIALGCALGYVALRFPDDGWRSGRPTLVKWFEAVSKRPSMSETVPKEPA